MVANSISCDATRLQRLLDGELSDVHQAEVAGHVESCQDCRRQLESLAADPSWWRETHELLSSFTRPLPGASHELAESERRLADRVAQGGMASRHNDEEHASDPRSPSVPLDFLAPSDNPAMLGRLGEFEILELIGCGGMGIVLKGYDHELNRYVAVKVLHPHCATSAAARKRFAREAQAAAAVVHQHVVAIHAVDANHHPPYLVMPFVPGESLQQRLVRQGVFDVIDALRIGQQVADGLSAAHAQGLVHRDIKPGNILLERNVERVLLTDFGLARAADDASLTQSGVIAGTPQYMSPEQARGEQVDARTDLFSLGTVLYTLLAGHSPFRAETAMGVLRRVCEDTPRPLSETNPAVPVWIDAITEKLHAKQPADRFESAAQVSLLLTNCVAHLQQPNAVPLPGDIAKLIRRHPRKQNRATSRTALAKIAVITTTCIVLTVMMLHFINPGLFSSKATLTDPATTNPSTTPSTLDNKWQDPQDAEVRDLDQRIRQLEQESEQW